ncbi:MAG TPA: hypothetical protein VLD37_01310 [Candidatus Bilamarchaeum sp.]|nr:hypothetical protein [Candidatus Bilamarchaeum sp.]
MDIDPDISVLRKMKLSSIEPALANEIIEFAQSVGYEATITSDTSLGFLVKIYKAERAKERRGRKALQKAENLILKLSSLHLEQHQRENQRRKAERAKKIPLHEPEIEIPVSKKTKELFESIGIKDEKFMMAAVGMLGEKEAGERVALVHATSLGKELAQRVFGEYPEVLLVMPDSEFISELEAMENKKYIIDIRKADTERPVPIWADYENAPGILLDSYADIERLLELQVPEAPPESSKREELKYRGKPMDPDDFMKVVMALGFSPMRETKHGTLMKSGSGGIMCIQKGHRKQEELNPSTIKKKLAEAGVDLENFERKRREMNL